ncbi:membrane protein [Mesorhizobium sp. J18]|uniref:YihY/virulence factor BrkB family protein n=1 Tax=Mesorhizobium sp. J18 TaxID=935263 RepID=UPI00119C7CFF|nr:YihY/virulence factor BrkB family protein [Mesorhizobium sp. J18]TWH01113.1 membrane protein [Mesorhizobium sp. J18]
MKTTEERARESGRGRNAEYPRQIPLTGWKDILWRVFREVSEDRIMLVAAGVTFYLLLALFPALTAFVSLYGFVADPVTIADHVSYLGGLLPSGGIDIIREQLSALASQDRSALSIGFIIALLVALWSANAGIKALFDALNIAYEEKEKRGFIALNLLSLTFTLMAMVLGILMIISVGVVPAVLAFLNLEAVTELLIRLLRWPLMLLVIALAIAIIYRYGPSRERPKWRWITWGCVIATVIWLAASAGFSFYLQNFADYNATYGSLGAVIGFMMWTWISVMILLVCAKLNAEMEHQTAHDSTIGRPKPLGSRGAVVADTLGRSAEEGRAPK